MAESPPPPPPPPAGRMRVWPRLVLALVVAIVGVAAHAARSARAGDPVPPPPPNLIADPRFEDSKAGDLTHWPSFVGATRGEGPTSRVSVDADSGALRLEADASTRRWLGVSQRVAVKPGATYRLSFELRAVGLQREGDQFDNAYVGVTIFGPPKRSATTLKRAEPAGEAWLAEEIVFRAESERADVIAFQSKSGRMEVRRPALEELRPSDAFDVLVRHMSRYYAHFDPAIADWSKLVAAHRAHFPPDGDPAAFVEAAKALLAPLRDPHVWIRPAPGADLVVPYAPTVIANGDLATIAAALTGRRRVGKVALLGELGPDVGYLNLASLSGSDAEFAEIGAALDAWRAAKRGVLVDLRWNGGGDERRGLAIAARFADEERVYARRRVRNGPGPTDLSAPLDARLLPAKDADPTTPVVVLVGPVCMSSGEGVAQMFHALPRVKLVGQPTRGASGNPAPVELPNGVDVWFSRWVDLLPDGTPLEGKGVPPDVVVDAKGPGDRAFEAGLALLREAPHARPR